MKEQRVIKEPPLTKEQEQALKELWEEHCALCEGVCDPGSFELFVKVYGPLNPIEDMT